MGASYEPAGTNQVALRVRICVLAQLPPSAWRGQIFSGEFAHRSMAQKIGGELT
jgi:hypothetical protein